MTLSPRVVRALLLFFWATSLLFINPLGIGAHALPTPPVTPPTLFLDPNSIRFSQGTVGHAPQLWESIRNRGFSKQEPINVVRYPDGRLVSLDNKRVNICQQLGERPFARVFESTDSASKGMIKSYGNNLRREFPLPANPTMADLVAQRIAVNNHLHPSEVVSPDGRLSPPVEIDRPSTTCSAPPRPPHPGARGGFVINPLADLNFTRCANIQAAKSITTGALVVAPGMILLDKTVGTVMDNAGFDPLAQAVTFDMLSVPAAEGLLRLTLRPERALVGAAGGASTSAATIAGGGLAAFGVYTHLTLSYTDSLQDSMTGQVKIGDYAQAAETAQTLLDFTDYGGLGAIGYGLQDYAEAAINGPVSPWIPGGAAVNVMARAGSYLCDLFR